MFHVNGIGSLLERLEDKKRRVFDSPFLFIV